MKADSQTKPDLLATVDPDITETTCHRLRSSSAIVPADCTPAPGGPHTLSKAALEMPTRAGRFQIVGIIAEGGMGVVLRGRDPELNRELAIKLLLPQHHNVSDFARRFQEEAQIAGQLEHPGIIPIHEIGHLPDGRPFFAMKLVQGETLSALLARRKSPAEDLPRFLKIFEQVCHTLAYAHSRRVIHRDLKPANIMVGSFGEVQVMDWGLAKALKPNGMAEPSWPTLNLGGTDLIEMLSADENGSDTRAGRVMGTPKYMSPEQARGVVELLDERCDVFGLGAILFEILTGEPPYGTGPAHTIFHKARQGDLTDAWQRLATCGADAELKRLARACLEPVQADRPADAGVVALRLTTHFNDVCERLRAAEIERAAAEARAVAAKVKIAAEQTNRRLTACLTAALLTLVVLGGCWLVWAGRVHTAARAEQARPQANP